MAALWIIIAIIVAVLGYSLKAMSGFLGRDDAHAFEDERTPGVPEQMKDYVRQARLSLPALEQLPEEDLSITSGDGLKLVGKLYRTAPDHHQIVIAFHGYHGSDRLDMARFAAMYSRLGMDFLLISERSHQHSEGRWITFGVRESDDGVRWCRKIIEIYGADVRILLHGISMGAATVDMMSGREDLPKQVIGVVSDCAYDALRTEAEGALQGPAPVQKISIGLLDFWAGILAHFHLKDAEPIRAVAHTPVPILFLHGESDTFVPTDCSRKLSAACAKPAGLVTFPGASHACSYTVDPERYEKAFTEFCSSISGR